MKGLYDYSRLQCFCILFISLLSYSTTRAGQSDEISIFEPTEEQNVGMALKVIEETINNPCDYNLSVLQRVIDPAEFQKVEEVINKLRMNNNGATVSIKPLNKKFILAKSQGGLSKTPLQVQLISDGGNTVLGDTATLFLNTSSYYPVLSSTTPMLEKTRTLVDQITSMNTQSGGVKTVVSKSLAANSSTSSPHLLVAKPVYGNIQRFSVQTSKQNFNDHVIFSRPYDVYAYCYIDGAFDQEHLIATDANWDRIIGSVRYPNNSSANAIEAIGQHGNDIGKFSFPAGVARLDYMWYVADAYNGRVLIYDLYTMDNAGSFTGGGGAYFDLPIDIAAARIPSSSNFNDRNFDKTLVAVVDQNRSEVKIFGRFGSYISTIGNASYGQNRLNKPTSICFAKDRFTHYPLDYVYVTDNGNKRVMVMSTTSAIMCAATDDGIFPSNAYLSSVDVDPYGFVYVLDSYNGVIYMFYPWLGALITTFGSKGTADGQFYYPNRISFTEGLKINAAKARGSEPIVAGDFFVTEHFGDQTGIRRYDIGLDILSHKATYIPKTRTDGIDYLKYKYSIAGYSSTAISVWLLDGMRVDTSGPWINWPGEDSYWFLLNGTPDGLYYIKLHMHGIFADYDTTIVDTITIDKTINPIMPHVTIYEHGLRDVAGVASTDCLAPGATLWKAWIKAHNNWDDADSIFYYQWTTGSNSVRPNVGISTDGTSFYDDLYTFRNSVFVYFADAPDTCTVCDTCHTECYLPYQNGDTINILNVYIYDMFGNRIECGEGGYNVEKAMIECTPTYMFYSKYYTHICNTPCSTCTPSVTPPGGGTGGCPMLYAWDGSQFNLENNILPESERKDSPQTNKIDFFPIFLPDSIRNGPYRFTLREDEREISLLDQIEVLAIDIPRLFMHPVLTDRQEIVNLSRRRRVPVSAVTQAGIDVFTLLMAEDEKLFTANSPGYIDFVYGIRDSMPLYKTMTYPLGGVSPDSPVKNLNKLAASEGGGAVPNIYSIYAQNAGGNYELVQRIYPRINPLSRVADLSPYINNGQLQVRLEWTSQITLNSLPYIQFESIPCHFQGLNLTKAEHSATGAALMALRSAGGNATILRPGEKIDLTFEGPPAVDSLRRILIVKAVGRYARSEEELWSNDASLSDKFAFDQNYPNPFNPNTTFRFALPHPAEVTLEIYNILGQRVRVLVNGRYEAGEHQFRWDGAGASGEPLSSGVYFAKFISEKFSSTRKVVVVK
jgi:hypothetical protein